VTCALAASQGACTQRCSILQVACCASCLSACGAPASSPVTTATGPFCEILVSMPSGAGSVSTDVMAEQGSCNQTLWTALTSDVAGAEALVRALRPTMLSMVLNGPRYMLLHGPVLPCCGDTGGVGGGTNAPAFDVGGLHFRRIAQTSAEAGASDGPYTILAVERRKRFTWCGGCEYGVLTDPQGFTYIMQSFAQMVDSTLDLADLPSLGPRLSLPTGWSYAMVTLPEDFIYSGAIADVITDDFANAYTKMYRLDCEVCAPPPDGGSAGLGIGAIVGIAVSGGVAAVALGVGAFLHFRKQGIASRAASTKHELPMT
jgi:hypothetical protein